MRHVTVGLLVLLLYPLGAFADFTGPVVSVLDVDTIEVLHNTYPERVRLSGIDWPEKGQAFGTEPSRLRQCSSSGKMSSFRPTARTSTVAHWPTCSYPMAPISITNWSRRVDAGGIGGMRRGIRC